MSKIKRKNITYYEEKRRKYLLIWKWNDVGE